jgi:hypothetical protein
VSFVLFVVEYVRFYHEGHEEHEGLVKREYVIEFMRTCTEALIQGGMKVLS